MKTRQVGERTIAYMQLKGIEVRAFLSKNAIASNIHRIQAELTRELMERVTALEAAQALDAKNPAHHVPKRLG